MGVSWFPDPDSGWSGVVDPFSFEQMAGVLAEVGREFAARSEDALSAFGRTGVLCAVELVPDTGAVRFVGSSSRSVSFAGLEDEAVVSELMSRFEPDRFLYRAGCAPGRVWMVVVSPGWSCSVVAAVATCL